MKPVLILPCLSAVVAVLMLLAGCAGSPGEPVRPVASVSASASAPSPPAAPKPPAAAQGQSVDVGRRFAPSGWMGDGESGTAHLAYDEACTVMPHGAPTCMKFSYTPGPQGWAGMYWLNKPQNWGAAPGENYAGKGFRRVTFWARGERGGETVGFKSGGVSSGEQHRDSFEADMGVVTLSPAWKSYHIDLGGMDLSSVIGLFGWNASQASNPGGLTFYLDDIRYE